MPNATGLLTEAERGKYWEDGFLHPIRAVSSDQAAAWRAELERVEREWLTADLPKPLSQYKRTQSQIVMPLAAEIASHPFILNAVAGILGDDLMVWGAEFFIKEAGTDAMVSWHQDLTYWGLGQTDHQCTAWIALSPATAESGCMRFVAGSHKQALVPHRDTFAENNLLSRGQEIAVEVDEGEAEDIVLAPGELSLHHGLMFHGSGPNRSADRRIGFAIRYINPQTRQEVAEKDYAMLVRGKDGSGAFINTAPPAAYFEPHALRLHDEIRAEQAKALAAGVAAGKAMYAGTAGVA